jgi:hypothetical protein
VQKLVDVGLVPPSGWDPWGHDRAWTRYEFALRVARLVDLLGETAASVSVVPSHTEEVSRLVPRLTCEFWPEVELIAAQLDDLEGDPGDAPREPTQLGDRLRAWLAGIPAGNWLHPTAQAILREYYGVATVAEPFPDVPRDHWALKAVERLREAGIVVGYPDGTFGGSTAGAALWPDAQ